MACVLTIAAINAKIVMNGSLMSILAVITDIPVEYHKHTHTE